MKAAFLSRVDAHLCAALLQQQQQAQGLGVSDVEVVAGEHANALRRTGLDHRLQVGQQEPQARGFDERDRQVGLRGPGERFGEVG